MHFDVQCFQRSLCGFVTEINLCVWVVLFCHVIKQTNWKCWEYFCKTASPGFSKEKNKFVWFSLILVIYWVHKVKTLWPITLSSFEIKLFQNGSSMVACTRQPHATGKSFILRHSENDVTRKRNKWQSSLPTVQWSDRFLLCTKIQLFNIRNKKHQLRTEDSTWREGSCQKRFWWICQLWLHIGEVSAHSVLSLLAQKLNNCTEEMIADSVTKEIIFVERHKFVQMVKTSLTS